MFKLVGRMPFYEQCMPTFCQVLQKILKIKLGILNSRLKIFKQSIYKPRKTSLKLLVEPFGDIALIRSMSFEIL